MVAPLFNALESRNYDIALYGKDIALLKYGNYGLYGKDILDRVENITFEEIKNFLEEESPDFIITGTSADDFTEKYLWKSAEELEIPSFAILDQWINYGVRFSEFGVSQLREYEKDKKFSYIPTKILTMDDYSKNAIIAEGIDSNRVLVSGQPYFDYLIEEKEKLNDIDTGIFRKDTLGCSDDELVVVFVSEPITKTYKEKFGDEYYWGYTEKTIFIELIEALNKFANKFKKNIKLVLRLHPKDDENNYDELIRTVDENNIEIFVDRKLYGLNLINSADLICGMSSMFLIESAILSKPILSIQIGLSRENPFVLHNKGLVRSKLTKKELESSLEDILIKKEYKANSLIIKKEAVENAIKFMEEILWRS